MADEDRKEEEQGGDEQQQKKKSPLLLIIGIGAGMLIAAVVAAVIVFKVLMAPPDETKEDTKDQAGKEIYFGKLFSFDEPIIVNLAGTAGQRYLKVSIQYEVSDDKVIEELKQRKPLMLDLLINILSSKSIDDVANTVGRNRLRREIIDKSNAEILSGKVINVYFTEFVIQ